MSTQPDYRVVQGRNTDELAGQVNRLLAKGYRLVGGLTVQHAGVGHYLTQALLKVPDTIPEEFTVGAAGVCTNCDSPLPPGCGGTFKGQEGCPLNFIGDGSGAAWQYESELLKGHTDDGPYPRDGSDEEG